jgi:hypothetical protein
VAFDDDLAARVRERLDRRAGVEERRMFGGVAFLPHGHLLVGVWRDSLIARLGPDAAAGALLEPHVRPFDVTGKPFAGWVLVGPAGVEEDDQLASWVDRAAAFVEALPAKAAGPVSRGRRRSASPGTGPRCSSPPGATRGG